MLALFPWRWIGVAALVVLLSVAYGQIKHIGHLESQLDAATEIANANAEIANQERAFRQRAEAAVADLASSAERARKQFGDKRQKVAEAGVADDAPLAPVLRRVLDGLPNSPAGGTACGD
jgi:hypothetical protein